MATTAPPPRQREDKEKQTSSYFFYINEHGTGVQYNLLSQAYLM